MSVLPAAQAATLEAAQAASQAAAQAAAISQDPTARFLQLFEASAVHHDRLFRGAAAQPVAAPDARLVDWLSRRLC